MPYDKQAVNISGSNTDLVIDGPGMVTLQAEAESMCEGMLPHTLAHLSVNLPAAGGRLAVTVQTVFTFNDDNNRWEFGDLSEESTGVFV